MNIKLQRLRGACVAIVDRRGNVLAVVTGSGRGNPNVAIGDALVSLELGRSFGGAVPITTHGRAIGAIGVSSRQSARTPRAAYRHDRKLVHAAFA